jgi:hypothetical protein
VGRGDITYETFTSVFFLGLCFLASASAAAGLFLFWVGYQYTTGLQATFLTHTYIGLRYIPTAGLFFFFFFFFFFFGGFFFFFFFFFFFLWICIPA